jgi:hypothetical protein
MTNSTWWQKQNGHFFHFLYYWKSVQERPKRKGCPFNILPFQELFHLKMVKKVLVKDLPTQGQKVKA